MSADSLATHILSIYRRLPVLAALALVAGITPVAAQQHGHKTATRQYSQTQMMDMLDQVETGKTPFRAAQQAPQGSHQQRSMPGAGAGMMRQPMYSGAGRAPMGQGMFAGVGHASPAMMGQGMNSMHAGPGNSAALGMLQRNLNGGGGQFLQKLKQKLSAMEQGGGMAPGQGQMLQQMLQGQGGPPGMGRPGLSGAPNAQFGRGMGMAPIGRGMPAMGGGGMGGGGGMPAMGGGMGGGGGMPAMGGGGMAPMGGGPRSLLKRASATTSGAKTSGAAAATPNMNDLEKQFEQQYGK